MIGRSDKIAIAGAVIASITLFVTRLFPMTGNTDIPMCIPWNRTYVLGIGNFEDRVKGVFSVTDFNRLMKIDNSTDSMKVIIDSKVRGCVWSESEQCFRCEKGDNVLDGIIDSLPFETTIDVKTRLAGGFACKSVKEMSRIINASRSSEYEQWQSLYPKVMKLYDEFMDGYKPKLNNEELLAIFMPMLMPITVIFLRSLKRKQ